MNLARTDALVDLRLDTRFIEEDSGTRNPGPGIRGRLGLSATTEAPEIWVLLGRDGNALATGQVPPTPETLVQALEAAGERNLVAELQVFLKGRPDHLEARRDLILALRHRLDFRLQEHPALPSQDLPPTLDQKVWGPIARQLDHLLREDTLGCLEGGLDSLLPRGAPERSSPLMKDLYRKYRPGMAALLQRLPESRTPWFDLLRMDQVLGEDLLLPTLEHLTLFTSPFHDLYLPFPQLGDRIQAEARRTGDWRSALPVLRLLWERGARNELTFSFVTGIGPERRKPTPEDLRQSDAHGREVAWTRLLVPLIEAMVRTENEGEALPLLASLDESWAPLGLEARALKLAQSLGRPDLGPRWASTIRTFPPRIPHEGMLSGEFRIFHQHQQQRQAQKPQEWSYGGRGYTLPFRQEGIGLEILEVPGSWKARLGWRDGEPLWVAVDRGGEIVLQGERLPESGALLATFLKARVPTARSYLQAFLKEHPGHLGALALLAQKDQGRAQEYWAARRPAGFSAPPPAMGEPERSAWETYFVSLQRLMDDPLATSPWLLRTYRPYGLVREAPGEVLSIFPPEKRRALRAQARQTLPEDLGAADLARRVLPRLELELTRRPSDRSLWEAWMALAPLMDRSAVDLLANLAPSPATSPGSWPSTWVLIEVCEKLKQEERWSQVAELLEPHWKAERERLGALARKEAPPRDARGGNWDWRLTRNLVETSLRLGRVQAADEILNTISAGHLQLGYLEDLCILAKELGFEDWAQKWSKKISN